jgi:plastocyanin
MLASLPADQKLGLGLVAGAFIVFALVSSFLIPRYRPQYPGRSGMKLFVIVAVCLFVGMLFAMEFLAREPKEASAGEGKAVKVTEREYKIDLAEHTLRPGTYTFDLKNDGQLPHNLTIDGPGVRDASTPTIGGGSSATVRATLKRGTYDLYCSVPGHKQQGMDTKLRIA